MIDGYPLRLMIPENEIQQKILRISDGLNDTYKGQELVLLMIMKGAVCFVADLIRNLHIKVSLDYLQCSSYHGTMQRSQLQVDGLEGLDFTNKNILIIDDIFDSGLTLSTVHAEVELKKPMSVKSMVLLDKKVEKKVDYRPDYSLFHIENKFVVGYGLDYKEFYRGLPGIFEVEITD